MQRRVTAPPITEVLQVMLSEDPIARRFFDFPEDCSREEREQILQRARYETFTMPGVNAKTTAFAIATVLAAFVSALAVSAALLHYSPLQDAGPIVRALASAAVLGVVLVPLQVVLQCHRARLIAPRVRELLEERRTDANQSASRNHA